MKHIYSVELFAGAGGLALGVEKAGFKNLFLNEIDKNAVKTLKKNRKKWNILEGSIDNYFEFFKENFEGKVDLLAGGFPCQSFSYAGKRKGLEDAKGTLFYSYAKAVEIIKPKAFLIENVKGLVTHDSGKTFKLIISTMESLGYFVKYKILNSNDYGVAQKRHRIFVVGFSAKKMFDSFTWPKIEMKKLVLRDVLKGVPDSIGASYPEKKRKVLKLVPPGGCWKNLPDEIAKAYMKGSYYLGGGKTGMARRISWDEPSLTLTTSPMQNQTERCHPDETRPFTVREYARIQSFPDSWKFEGPMTSQYRQIGNAVPVKMAEVVAKQIYKVLAQK